ncbi:MAG: site-specific integrase [Gemmatimonadetes bacterium]|nr:site-specific integrase [Gemmatimonadota bacterium]MYE93354.1 site-specific integrase [Gemmatimonadota bacterium]MYJ67140.1 site-specific integrase [Gemmatimonadota bacterium]
MMARAKRSRRSYSAGEWGRNRVRVFSDPRTGIMQVEWREDGRKMRRSLRHRDWVRAKMQGDEIAAGLAEPVATEAEPEPLTLKTLFDIYGEEVTPTKAERSWKYDRAAMKMFLRFFGEQRKAATLSQRDWDRFIRARRAGTTGGNRQPAGDRTIQRDLKFLLAVLNWAARSRDEEGRLLIESNPLRGLKAPSEKNPTRVILTQAEYEALLRVADEVDWRFRVALVLAHETGHRIGAICQLRWSDVDLDTNSIRWRGEHEKTGYEHRTPITSMAQAVLVEARRRNPGIGDAPVMPAPKEPSACMTRWLASSWWKRAEALAGLQSKWGRGWHSLRRKFASDLMDLPLKVLCDLGGWKTAQTVLQCYQRPDEDRLRKALEAYRETGSASN